MSKKIPRFTVTFAGDGIDKKSLPFPAAYAAAQAIRRLIMNQVVEEGEGAKDDYDVDQPDSLRILDVKNGSAKFIFALPAPSVYQRLEQIGSYIRSPDEIRDEVVESVFSSVRSLSELARKLRCKICLSTNEDPAIAEFNAGTFEQISAGRVMTGITSIIGRVERVGGASAQHCAMRVADRSRLLIARVGSQDLVRELGQLLYKTASVEGNATWVGRRWYLTDFEILSVKEHKPGRFNEGLALLRTATGNAWDSVPDVAEYLSDE